MSAKQIMEIRKLQGAKKTKEGFLLQGQASNGIDASAGLNGPQGLAVLVLKYGYAIVDCGIEEIPEALSVPYSTHRFPLYQPWVLFR